MLFFGMIFPLNRLKARCEYKIYPRNACLNQHKTITLSAVFQNKQVLNNKNGLNSIYDVSVTLAIRLLNPWR
jgi:hypothetical protein